MDIMQGLNKLNKKKKGRGGGIGSAGTGINKYWRQSKNKLAQAGLDVIDPLMQKSQQGLMSWMEYDPTQNPVTSAAELGGSGMGAILDALARQSYQTASTAINEQADEGTKRILEALASRGVLRSSRAPIELSALESQRINAIQRAGGQIEGQRLQGQLTIPQMMMSIGGYGAKEQQRNIQNLMQRLGLATNTFMGVEQLEAQKEATQAANDAAQMQGIAELGLGLGSLAAGIPPGTFSGIRNLFSQGGQQQATPTVQQRYPQYLNQGIFPEE